MALGFILLRSEIKQGGAVSVCRALPPSLSQPDRPTDQTPCFHRARQFLPHPWPACCTHPWREPDCDLTCPVRRSPAWTRSICRCWQRSDVESNSQRRNVAVAAAHGLLRAKTKDWWSKRRPAIRVNHPTTRLGGGYWRQKTVIPQPRDNNDRHFISQDDNDHRHKP